MYQKSELDKKQYEVEKVTEYNYFVLREDDKFGVMDKQANIVIKPSYENVIIPNPGKPVFICYDENGKTLALNEKNEKLYTEFEQVEPIRLKNILSDLMYEKSILTFKKDGKVGLITLDGKEIVKSIYDEITGLPYKEGEVLVKQGDNYGVINKNGAILLEAKYSKISTDEYYDEEAGYKKSGYIVEQTTDEGYRYGYIDVNFNQMMNVEYNELSRVTDMEESENIYIIAAKNGQFGLYKNGNKIIENSYQSIRYNKTNHIFIIEKSKKYGVASIDGNIIIPVEYSQIDITGKYIYAQKKDETKVFDSQGKIANIDSTTEILETSNPNYKIKMTSNEETLYGIIDNNNKELVESKYNYIDYLFENYFIASNSDGKLGVINDKGEEIIPIENDSVQKITNNEIVEVSKVNDNITKLYSNEMELICEIQKPIIVEDTKYIKVYNDTDTFYFSKDGKEIEYSEIAPQNMLFAKKQDNKWGYVDSEEDTKIEYTYDKVTDLNKYGFAGIKQDDKWGVIDSQGNIIVEPTYTIKTETEPFFIGEYYRVEYGYGENYYTK